MATVEIGSRLTSTALFSPISTLWLSFWSTALRAFANAPVAYFCCTTGTMLSEACRFLSSVSTVRPFAAGVGSEVKTRPTSTLPVLIALMVSGPPASSVVRLENFMP